MRLNPHFAADLLRRELEALRSAASPQTVMDGLPAYAGATYELIGSALCIQLDPERCEDPENPVTVRVPTRLRNCQCDLHSSGEVCPGHTKGTWSRALIPGPIRPRQRRKWAGSADICDWCYPLWAGAHRAEWDVVVEVADAGDSANQPRRGEDTADELAQVLADLKNHGIKSADEV